MRPSNESLETAPRVASKKVRNTSLGFGGAGAAFAIWKLFKNGNDARHLRQERKVGAKLAAARAHPLLLSFRPANLKYSRGSFVF